MMLISARLKDGPLFRRGCVAVAVSEDLENWEVCAPFATPMLTHCPECPELFRLGDWWYLLRSRYDGQAQTFYRVAPTPRGPWSARRWTPLTAAAFTREVCRRWPSPLQFRLDPLPQASRSQRRLGLGRTTGFAARITGAGGWHAGLAPGAGNRCQLPRVDPLGMWRPAGSLAPRGRGSRLRSGRQLRLVRAGGRAGGEVLLDTTIEIAAGTGSAGVLLEIQGAELEAGYYIGIERCRSA